MATLTAEQLDDLQSFLKDWLRHAGRTQADLRRALRASSIRMPVLLEELARIHGRDGLIGLAERAAGAPLAVQFIGLAGGLGQRRAQDRGDLELAGGLLHLDALSHCFDIRERTVLSKGDNLSTRFWERKGSTTSDKPPAYLLRLFGMHLRIIQSHC